MKRWDEYMSQCVHACMCTCLRVCSGVVWWGVVCSVGCGVVWGACVVGMVCVFVFG